MRDQPSIGTPTVSEGRLTRLGAVGRPVPPHPDPLPQAKHCPHLFMVIYHYLIVPQPLMYSMVGCLSQMRPPFVPHQRNLPTGPVTNSRPPNCPINVSTSACA